MAVTAIGSAREITDPGARAAAIDEYLAKHPHLKTFLASPGCAVVKVDADAYYLVTHFESVVRLHMPHADHAAEETPADAGRRDSRLD